MISYSNIYHLKISVNAYLASSYLTLRVLLIFTCSLRLYLCLFSLFDFSLIAYLYLYTYFLAKYLFIFSLIIGI